METPAGIEEDHSLTQGGTGHIGQTVRHYAPPARLSLALRLLLGGGAGCVAGLFRGCRAAGAAGRAHIPVLNHNVLLVWS